MNIPYVRGLTAKQAHVGIPDGTVEEEYGRNGFSGRYAHLYRSEAPTGWTRIEGPLRPRAYDLKSAFSRQPLFFNDDVRIAFFEIREPMNYYFRNADGDEVFFVHEGSGRIETDFGPLDYEKGDYILIPRGTVYRLDPVLPTRVLSVESFSEVKIPDRGMLGQHALFDPAVIQVPTPQPTTNPTDGGAHSSRDYELKIKRCDEITTVHYPSNPINTVGWKGTVSAMKLNVRDIRPVLSDRYHLPPSAHSTFVANNFVICTFLPRPLENGDPEAMKVPFYHSNIDFDEVLFYHDGEFFSRDGIGPGMLTFHPQGIHHGPQKKAIERSKDKVRTQEVAVMIDTRKPLKIAAEAAEFEIEDYWKSWMK